MKYTITEVAKEFGVSCSTVSRALNNSSGVSEELRKKIVQFAEDVGYYPNKSMRNSITGRLNTISLILGDIRNPFYSELVFRIQKLLNEHGYMVTVFSSEYNEEKEIKYIRLSEKYNFSGIFLLTACTERISKELKRSKIPVIMVNRSINSFKTDTVILDNFKAGYIAAMHLIELGHLQIGFLMGPQNSSTSVQRYEGFCKAMSNYDLEVDPELIYQGDLKMETGREVAKRYLNRKKNATGMVISNDMTALGFIGYCEKKGLKIPENLSVVSFDDIQFASLENIQLTTISQHVEEMSQSAVDLMLRRIYNEKKEIERIILDPTLIVRKTTRSCAETVAFSFENLK